MRLIQIGEAWINPERVCAVKPAFRAIYGGGWERLRGKTAIWFGPSGIDSDGDEADASLWVDGSVAEVVALLMAEVDVPEPKP